MNLGINEMKNSENQAKKAKKGKNKTKPHSNSPKVEQERLDIVKKSLAKYDVSNQFNWPTQGKLFMYYNYWIWGHQMFVAYIIPSRMSFEDKPQFISVLCEAYLNFVFFVDLVR